MLLEYIKTKLAFPLHLGKNNLNLLRLVYHDYLLHVKFTKLELHLEFFYQTYLHNNYYYMQLNSNYIYYVTLLIFKLLNPALGYLYDQVIQDKNFLGKIHFDIFLSTPLFHHHFFKKVYKKEFLKR